MNPRTSEDGASCTAKRFKKQWIFFITGWLALNTALVLSSAHENREIDRRERERFTTLMHVVEENLIRQLGATNSALGAIRADHAYLLRLPNGADLLSRRLTAMADSMPGVRALIFLNSQGTALASNRRELVGRNFSDRDYFQIARADGDQKSLYVSPPFQTVLGVFSIALSKIVVNEQGSTVGVVAATLDPDFFASIIESVRYSKDMWVGVAHGSGRLVLERSDQEKKLPESRENELKFFSQHLNRGGGFSMVQEEVPLAGERRLIAQKTISPQELRMDIPLLLAFTRDTSAIYEEWSSDLLLSVISMVAMVLVSAMGLRILQKRECALFKLRLVHDEEKRVSEAKLRISAAAFDSQEGIIVADEDNKILAVNRALSSITGFSPEDCIGKTPAIFQSGRHERSFYENLWGSISTTGSWQGEVWNKRKNGDVFPAFVTITAVPDSLGKVTHYVGNIIDISERKAAEKKIESLAFYDSLTTLPNRRLLMDRLEHSLNQCLKNKTLGGLLFIDLDNFKTLNDTQGHMQGDRLLQIVAHRLREIANSGDTVARLGGDEFVIMTEPVDEDISECTAKLQLFSEKVMNMLSQPYQLFGTPNHAYHCTPSIGITLFGEKYEKVEEPLKRADLALYRAKSEGRNAIRFFDQKTQDHLIRYAELESQMRHAIGAREFILFYQAQVGANGKIFGAEVLLRWKHPGGMVSPGEFIPLAEETGLVIPLGRWVMDTACAQLARWSQQADRETLSLAVNVSARQFHDVSFVSDVAEAMLRHGVRPGQLKLELTESILIVDVQDVVRKMEALRNLGVSFSLDDFGTGYSSLVYLKKLPLHQLKIDQGFVRDILQDSDDAAIAGMITALGYSMGLNVIAEGVENEAQRELLAGLGCQAYQGYLYCRPMPIEEFEVYLTQTMPQVGEA